MLLPFLLVAVLEVSLRAANYGGDLSLFTRFSLNGEDYLTANPRVGARYFPHEVTPPAPAAEPFRVNKPEHSFRVFVLGESAAAGFPYVANASFADFVGSALEELLPGDTVEVVNLGIAATNSYTIADLASDVIAHSPDAVLIYSGHNEYYGALGVGSSERLSATPALGRLYLSLQRFRTVRLLRNAVDGVMQGGRARGGAAQTDSAVTRMETVARDQRILYKSTTYERGKAQFESNLRAALGKFQHAGVPVFIGTLASNVRDLAPFAALSGADTSGDASAAYKSGQLALGAANLAAAESLFTLARDEDFVRFRAPTDFNAIIRRVAKDTDAHLVGTEDDIRAASQFRIPGNDLFFEHVHLRSRGYGIVGRSFVVAMQKAGTIPTTKSVASVEHFDSALALSALDQRIAEHSINTVTTRWPFVAARKSQDYRATYHPIDMVDTLALAVSRGALRWDRAKLTLAAKYEANAQPELALAEYRGLIRHEPLFEGGYEGAGRALLALGKRDSAEHTLQRAYALQPTGGTALSLGILALERKDLRSATRLLEESVRLQPMNPDAFYRLSFAYALARDIERARSTAVRVYQLQPAFPGLAGWLSTLGIPPPNR
ncbi:MAG TPA: hypothetical protein VM166_04210 [Gemmatimonadaceae bacterium]|nr:hypothetical protein [Gemmatimonadaceae bacterium]